MVKYHGLKELISSAPSPEPCAKLVFEHGAPADNRLEIRYLVGTCRLYLGARLYDACDHAVAWSPLFAEIDSEPPVV